MNERQTSKGVLAALLFAMTFPSFMSWLEFMVLTGDGQELQAGLRSVFAVGKIIQFFLPVACLLWLEGGRIQVRKPTFHGLGLAVGFAVLVAGGAFLLYYGWLRQTELFDDTSVKIKAWLDKIGLASPAGFLLMAGFVAIPHALLEEYYWRWFVFGRLRWYLPVPWAIAVASLAFMGHHVIVLAYYFPGQFWIAALPFSLCVAGGGAAWAWLYQRFETIYPPWISHVLVDIAVMVVGYDLMFVRT